MPGQRVRVVAVPPDRFEPGTIALLASRLAVREAERPTPANR